MTTAKAKQTVTQFNVETGEIIEREMLDDEIAIINAQNAQIAAQQAETDAKIAARASALAKLAELGLTEAEIAAL